MFLSVEELFTHLHDEVVDAISRDDHAAPLHAIEAAVAEAKSYLGAYDTGAIFNAEGDSRNQLLLLFVKDIAVWHFVNLGNACTDLELREKRYDRAIAWLRAVQQRKLTPSLPPLAEGQEGYAASIIWGANPKRRQHF